MMKRLLGSRALQEKPQKPQYNPVSAFENIS